MAKTIFLNDSDQVIIYDSTFHSINHEDYIKRYCKNLKVDEYIPILLTNYNHCVIDLSTTYMLGVVYLPISMSKFQKDYFVSQKDYLEKYTLYLNGHSLIDPILINDLIDLINLTPTKQKEKKLC